MKKLFRYSLLLIVSMSFLSTGCLTSGNKARFTYPSDIESICYGHRNEAKACIEEKGKKIEWKKSLVLTKRPGERKINGHWAWKENAAGNYWVTGLCWDGNPMRIEIGVHPQNFNEWRHETIRHEHGHYCIMSNYKMYGHPPEFKSCFWNWNDSRSKHLDHGDGIESVNAKINGRDVIICYIPEENIRTVEELSKP